MTKSAASPPRRRGSRCRAVRSPGSPERTRGPSPVRAAAARRRGRAVSRRDRRRAGRPRTRVAARAPGARTMRRAAPVRRAARVRRRRRSASSRRAPTATITAIVWTRTSRSRMCAISCATMPSISAGDATASSPVETRERRAALRAAARRERAREAVLDQVERRGVTTPARNASAVDGRLERRALRSGGVRGHRPYPSRSGRRTSRRSAIDRDGAMRRRATASRRSPKRPPAGRRPRYGETEEKPDLEHVAPDGDASAQGA